MEHGAWNGGKAYDNLVCLRGGDNGVDAYSTQNSVAAADQGLVGRMFHIEMKLTATPIGLPLL